MIERLVDQLERETTTRKECPMAFNPDATYDLYRLAEDGERDPFPYYRIAERHFYNNAIDRLPDDSYRKIAGTVVLSHGPTNPVIDCESELTQLGVIEAGVFSRGDGERFVLVEVK